MGVVVSWSCTCCSSEGLRTATLAYKLLNLIPTGLPTDRHKSMNIQLIQLTQQVCKFLINLLLRIYLLTICFPAIGTTQKTKFHCSWIFPGGLYNVIRYNRIYHLLYCYRNPI